MIHRNLDVFAALIAGSVITFSIIYPILYLLSLVIN